MNVEWFVSGTILLVLVLVVRALLGRKLGAGLRYGLWLLVLVRLLVPVSLGSSVLSWENILPSSKTQQLEVVQAIPEHVETPSIGKQPTLVTPERAETSTVSSQLWIVTLDVIWKIGMAVTALWFLLRNFSFAYHLQRTRILLQRNGSIPVYIAETPSPCLFGLLHPSIYLTTAAAGDETIQSHVLHHEMVHLRHGDHIWACLRTVCVVLWWYHPLVWLAAYLSRTDAELACDASVLRQLGHSERIAYGRTILTLAANTHVSASTAATLSKGGRQIQKRIQAIAVGQTAQIWAVVLTVLLALLAMGCAFTNGNLPVQEPITLPEEEQPPVETPVTAETPPAADANPLAEYYVDLPSLSVSDGALPSETVFGDRVFRMEDTVENALEAIVYDFYYLPMAEEFQPFVALAGDALLQQALENNVQSIQEGRYESEITIHSLETLTTEEIFTFSEPVQESITDTLETYGLVEYGIVGADFSWILNEALQASAPQRGDGRYLRYYLIGRADLDENFLIYDVYWAEL